MRPQKRKLLSSVAQWHLSRWQFHHLSRTSWHWQVSKFLCSSFRKTTRTQLNESMALSYLSEGEAPRDFKVSSTESDGHYTKCLLCYTVKRNFYCQDCIKAGSFVHTSMPYSDRWACLLSNLWDTITYKDFVTIIVIKMSWRGFLVPTNCG